MKVTLTNRELAMAAECGIMRHIAALSRNLPDANGYDGADGWTKHIEGACGEVACAKAIGRFWSPTVNTFHAADLGTSIQVRTRSRQDYELIVRRDDADDHAFVLVLGKAPTFQIKGYLFGREAKRDEWLAGHGNRPPAWFVPHEYLRSIDEISLKEAA